MGTTTTIITKIEGESFVVECPHIDDPDYARVSAPDESECIADMIRNIREYRNSYEAQGSPVPWNENPHIPASKEVHVRKLTGLWPKVISPRPQIRHYEEDQQEGISDG